MTPYSASTCERLASELEAADKEMTPGPWGVLPEQFDPWHVNAPSRDVCALPYDHRPDERAADAHSICNLRNSAPEVAAALRAAVAEVERLSTRQQELLATIVRVTNETPFPDEAKDALAQRGKLVAEIGTLRTRLAALSALVDRALVLVHVVGANGGMTGEHHAIEAAIRAAAKEAK